MKRARAIPRVVPTNKEALRCIVHVGQNGIAGESGYYGRVRIYGRSCAILEPGNDRLLETCSNVLWQATDSTLPASHAVTLSLLIGCL